MGICGHAAMRWCLESSESIPQQESGAGMDAVGEVAVKDKTVLLVDDMVDTAGSVTSGLETLRFFGCKEDIYVATTHPVFSGPAIERLKAAKIKEVVVTDTIPLGPEKQFDGLTTLSIAPLLAEVISRNIQKQSISPLFD